MHGERERAIHRSSRGVLHSHEHLGFGDRGLVFDIHISDAHGIHRTEIDPSGQSAEAVRRRDLVRPPPGR